jgi:hypothetical protein
MTRALLGLYNIIWHWYRPNGAMSMEEVTEFFIRRQLALLGLPPELADGNRLRAADDGKPRAALAKAAKSGGTAAKAGTAGGKAPTARRRGGGTQRSAG